MLSKTKRLVFLILLLFISISAIHSSGKSFRIAGWLVWCDNFQKTETGFSLRDVNLKLFSIVNGGELLFPEIALDNKERLVKATPGTSPCEFVSTNGYRVVTHRYELNKSGPRGEGLYLAGKVFLPTKGGKETALVFDSPSIFLNKNGGIVFSQSDKAIAYPLGGWTMYVGKGYQGLIDDFGGIEGLMLENILLDVPQFKAAVTIDKVSLYPDGDIRESGTVTDARILTMNGRDFSISEGKLGNNGLEVQGFLNVIKWWDSYIFFDSLVLTPDGSVRNKGRSMNDLESSNKNCTIKCSGLSFDGVTFKADRLECSFRKGMDVSGFSFYNVTIESDGRIVPSFQSPVFELFGCTFFAEEIVCDRDRFRVKGSAREEETSTRYSIRDLSIFYEGIPNAVTLADNKGNPIDLLKSSAGNETLLFRAIKNKDAKKAETLIAAGTRINATFDSLTPLAFSVIEDNLEMVKLFLKHKADPNIPDEHGQTPLYLAALKGNTPIMKALLSSKAKTSIGNGVEPLIASIQENKKEAFDLLVASGADVNVKGVAFGGTTGSALYAALNWGRDEMFDVLLKKGADVNSARSDGFTPLMHVALGENTKRLSLLLQKKADPNSKTREGKTALIFAASSVRAKMVELLLASGADPNAQDKEGDTALIISARANNDDITVKLIKANAEVSIKNKKGETALHFLRQRNDKELIALIKATGDSIVGLRLKDVEGLPVWEKRIPGVKFISLCEAHDSGFLAVGFSEENAWTYTATYFLVKLKDDGEVAWQKNYSTQLYTGGYDSFCTVLKAKGSGYFLAGQRYQSNENSAWVARIDDNGELVWQRNLVSLFGLVVSCAKTTGTGELVLAGTITGIEDKNAWAAKLDGDGNLLWAESIGAEGDEIISDLVVTENGSIVLAGSTDSSGAGNRDCLLVKIDKDGKILAQYTFGWLSDEIFDNIAVSPSGDLIASGSASVSGRRARIIVACFKENLSLEWKREWHFTETGNTSLHIGKNDEVFVSAPGLLAKLSAEGEPVFVKNTGEGANIVSHLMDFSVDGLRACGFIHTGHGGYDGWILQIRKDGTGIKTSEAKLQYAEKILVRHEPGLAITEDAISSNKAKEKSNVVR